MFSFYFNLLLFNKCVEFNNIFKSTCATLFAYFWIKGHRGFTPLDIHIIFQWKACVVFSSRWISYHQGFALRRLFCSLDLEKFAQDPSSVSVEHSEAMLTYHLTEECEFIWFYASLCLFIIVCHVCHSFSLQPSWLPLKRDLNVKGLPAWVKAK